MVYWNIPYVSQVAYGHGRQPDLLGCWYACLCMVGFAFGEGPRLGVPDLYRRAVQNRHGEDILAHYPIDMSNRHPDQKARNLQNTLLRNERLSKMLAPATWCSDADKIASILWNFGPLLVTREGPVGNSGRSFSHFDVLIGVKSTTTVIVHEPHSGPFVTHPINKFFEPARIGSHPILRKHSPLGRLADKFITCEKLPGRFSAADFT